MRPGGADRPISRRWVKTLLFNCETGARREFARQLFLRKVPRPATDGGRVRERGRRRPPRYRRRKRGRAARPTRSATPSRVCST
ncbi:hypothetical protein EVAR_65481_1 [Eumeta japonica]|uniref:Uncharacterized protein n=1 Tax=Eumeta variegata TaxID=151549 RepID=A0A4C2A6N4_EUMVA|nr:hypothetical protein EVAR_65481_1 [Eumeta japonica]